MRSTFSKFVVCLLALAACSPAAAIDTTTTSTSTTTTLATTTSSEGTSTTEVTTLSPINGLPVADPDLLNRRLLAVKIDNHPNARPHSGINHADAVFEIRVEGISRFLTLWMQSDAEFLGPMRSGRPTDSTLLTALNHPTFAISGAQGWVQQMIRSKDINLLTETTPAAFRVSFRRAPHNLYTTTAGLRADADAKDYENLPPTGPIWEFGPMPTDATAASAVHIDFRGTDVDWEWDAATATWLRSADGRVSDWRDEDGTEGRIGFPVLIGLETEQYIATPPSGAGKGLPASHTTGSGQAWVFADGTVVEGTWERETEQDWFTLTDADGDNISVPPGQVWISLVPDTGGLTYE